jgi:hypothetical protein
MDGQNSRLSALGWVSPGDIAGFNLQWGDWVDQMVPFDLGLVDRDVYVNDWIVWSAAEWMMSRLIVSLMIRIQTTDLVKIGPIFFKFHLFYMESIRFNMNTFWSGNTAPRCRHSGSYGQSRRCRQPWRRFQAERLSREVHHIRKKYSMVLCGSPWVPLRQRGWIQT